MITESALNILSNPWVWAAVVIAVSALLVLSVWRGQESAEDGARQIRQMQEDPDFGARREPIYAGLLSATDVGTGVLILHTWQRNGTGICRAFGNRPVC